MNHVGILIGKLIRFLIRLYRKGGGSALPGAVVGYLFPGLMVKTLGNFKKGVVLITGSAGKSSTTKMVTSILEAHDIKVFTNPSTANISQGLIASIIEGTKPFRKTPGDVAVLEVDEAHAEALCGTISPAIVTILNVMEDQLDRFEDPSIVRGHLIQSALSARRGIVLNADDPNLRSMPNNLHEAEVTWFGLDPQSCFKNEKELPYSPVFDDHAKRPSNIDTEVFNYVDGKFEVKFESQKLLNINIKLRNRGLHYASDCAAAIETSRVFLGESFDSSKTEHALNNLPPVFARGELVKVNGETVEFVLVQNSGSLQINLDNLPSEIKQLFFAIGRDAHDPSWLWAADYSKIKFVDVVSGYHAAEAELLFAYNNIPVGFATDNLEKALDSFFNLPTPDVGHKTIVFSADAMRRIRRILGFWGPEEGGN